MTHRRIHTLVWLLLPLFALRAMVPVGYMINLSGGELSMAVCPMHQTLDTGQSNAEQSKSGDGAQTESKTKIQCPFAAALCSATFVGLGVPAINVVVDDGVFADASNDIYFPFGPFRSQQSRAPPARA